MVLFRADGAQLCAGKLFLRDSTKVQLVYMKQRNIRNYTCYLIHAAVPYVGVKCSAWWCSLLFVHSDDTCPSLLYKVYHATWQASTKFGAILMAIDLSMMCYSVGTEARFLHLAKKLKAMPHNANQ